MTQLYKLTDNYQQTTAAIQALFEAGEIDLTSVTDTLEGLQGELNDKAINVALHIKNLRSDLEQLENAKKSFDARIKAAKQSLDFYENYLDLNLQKAGITELKSDFVVIKYKKLPAVVEITGDVPAEYSRVIPESSEPDKVAIATALKAGSEFEFAKLITGRTKLDIK